MKNLNDWLRSHFQHVHLKDVDMFLDYALLFLTIQNKYCNGDLGIQNPGLFEDQKWNKQLLSHGD